MKKGDPRIDVPEGRTVEELQAQVKMARLRLFGAEHPETLTIMGNIASTYRNQGQWKGVEELEVQVKKDPSQAVQS